MGCDLLLWLATNSQTVQIGASNCGIFPFTIAREPGHRAPVPADTTELVHDAAETQKGQARASICNARARAAEGGHERGG